jgi:vancomycin resistance protein YoaR
MGGVRQDWDTDSDLDSSDSIVSRFGFTEHVPRSKEGARVVFWTLLLVMFLVSALYLAAYFLAGDRVPRGATVSGVAIGGLTPAAAEERLQARLGDRLSRPVSVEYADRVQTVRPADAGLGFDYHASVRRAGGGGSSLDPRHLWDYYTGGDDVDAVVIRDDPKMQDALLKLSTGVGLPVKEGSIRFQAGRIAPVYSRPGLGLDRTAAAKLLVNGLLAAGTGDPVKLPVTTAEPYITDDAVRAAVRDFARPAMSAPVVLLLGRHRVVATPKQFSEALAMIPSGRQLVPVVNGDVLLAALRPDLRAFAAKPRSAVLRVVAGRPTLVPAKIGLVMDVPYLEQHFAEYAALPAGQRVMPVHAVLQEPAVTTTELRKLGIRSAVSSYTAQAAPSQAAALRRLAGRLDGAVVRPGQTFSLASRLGAVDRSTAGAQGALNKTALATFNAAFLAGYDDAGHQVSPVHVAGQPLAREAVLPAGADVAFRDNTAYGAVLTASVRGSALTVRVWSTPTWTVRSSTGPLVGRRPSPVVVSSAASCRPRTGEPGFSVTVTRVARHGGKRLRSTYAASYQPSVTVECGAPATSQ